MTYKERLIDVSINVSWLLVAIFFLLILSSFVNKFSPRKSFDISTSKPILEDRYYLGSYRKGVTGAIRSTPAVVDRFTGRFYIHTENGWSLHAPVDEYQGRNADQIQNSIESGL